MPFAPIVFASSASSFAQNALRAHHRQDYARVALEAGTALEHLLKACLAKRSPALLADLKGEASYPSLLQLLRIPAAGPPGQVRTVGLRDALKRVKTLVKSTASDDDLQTLISLRDGTVHAALNDKVEERLLVAFVTHADALLMDLVHPRDEFWGPDFLPVVDALLADASDKVAHSVKVKLANARANFQREWGNASPQILRAIRKMAKGELDEPEQEPAKCPACASTGVATGDHDVEWETGQDEDHIPYMHGTVWFIPWAFRCHVCGLRLISEAELVAAHMEIRRKIEGADPLKYEPPVDEDSFYEAYRDRYD